MKNFEEGWYYFTEGDTFGFGPGTYKLEYNKYYRKNSIVYKFRNSQPISWDYPDYYIKLLKDGMIVKLTDEEVMIKDIIE